MNDIREAFFQVCSKAKQRKGCYVSMYVRVPYYGGPEEGGWWGEDHYLVASQAFISENQAKEAEERIEQLAQQLSDDARKAFGDHCRATMDWLETRGLDADFLPEVDGEESYYVVTEEREGSLESRGSRHYE